MNSPPRPQSGTPSPEGETAVAPEEPLLRLRQMQLRDAQFRRIYESPLMGILFTDDSGRVLEANDTFLSMLGFTREELAAGRLRWDEQTPPEWQHVNHQAVRELQEHGVTVPFEKEYLRKDGARVSALVGSTRIEEQDWNVTFALDITERKRAESNLQFLADASRLLATSLDIDSVLKNVVELSVPAISDGCAVDLLQPDGSIRRVEVAHRDPQAVRRAWEVERRFPLTVDSAGVVARVIRTGRPELVREVTDEVLVSAARGEEHLEVLRQAGMKSFLVVPMSARGQILGGLVLITTDSGRRYDHGDLRVAEELARRASLCIDNALLYREARGAVQLRDEFLSIASHELKTPLTPLSLKLQALARDLANDPPSPTTDRRRRDVEVLQRQVRRLSDLVTDLLDVSRIAAGKLSLEFEPVELTALVREVALRFEPEAARSGSTLEVHGDGQVQGDWDRLRLEQVITNLLSNAVKYGSGSPIEMRVWSEDRHARLSVRDAGIGIEPESLPRIFERFERGVSQRHYGGLGLGLFITRQIVEALGGTIAVESKPGRGALFTVTLPLR